MSNTIITVPAAPTNLVAVPFESSCNEVQFSWNPPPEDEQNGAYDIVGLI